MASTPALSWALTVLTPTKLPRFTRKAPLPRQNLPGMKCADAKVETTPGTRRQDQKIIKKYMARYVGGLDVSESEIRRDRLRARDWARGIGKCRVAADQTDRIHCNS